MSYTILARRSRGALTILELLFFVLVAVPGCRDHEPVVGGSSPDAPAASSATIRVMPLGDSITQADAAHDSYRRPLWKSLRARGYEIDFVGSQSEHHGGPPPHPDFDTDHEGHWGFRVDEILEGIEDWAEAHRPDVLLVHLGSNDLFQRQGVDSTLEELGELIDTVRAIQPRAVFLVAQIIPTRMPAANERIEKLNRTLPALARDLATEVSPVIVVDAFTGFDPHTQTYDGVHPNADGEIHLSERFVSVLETVLSSE